MLMNENIDRTKTNAKNKKIGKQELFHIDSKIQFYYYEYYTDLQFYEHPK